MSTEETFSNPLAPADHQVGDGGAGGGGKYPLRNEDFRKMLMTPRAVGDSSRRSADDAHSFTHHRPAAASATSQG